MGSDQVTIQNLEIIKVDLENNCILVKGSIPGAKKTLVVIRSAAKSDKKNPALDLITYEVKEENQEVSEDNTSEATLE